MANNRDTFSADIYVNNKQAQDAIGEMRLRLKKLNEEYDRLAKRSKQDTADAIRKKKEIDSLNASIENASKGTRLYEDALKSLSSRSVNNLIKLQRQLNSEIKKLDPNTKEFRELSENYRRVTDRIRDLEKAQKGITRGNGWLQSLNGVSSALLFTLNPLNLH